MDQPNPDEPTLDLNQLPRRESASIRAAASLRAARPRRPSPSPPRPRPPRVRAKARRARCTRLRAAATPTCEAAAQRLRPIRPASLPTSPPTTPPHRRARAQGGLRPWPVSADWQICSGWTATQALCSTCCQAIIQLRRRSDKLAARPRGSEAM